MRTPGFLRMLILVIVAVLWTVSAAAQNDEATLRFRLAQSFEQSGDWERAAIVYESLHAGDPQNYVFFDGLRRSYTQLKQYEKAIALVRSRLRMNPNDPMLSASLGGLFYQMGEEATADSVWKSVIRSGPSNPNLYRLVASQMIEYRLYEQAIAVYNEARGATGKSDLFAEELGSLYGALLQYESAAREYVEILRTRPQQLSYVQSRLSTFINRPDGLQSAFRVAKEAIRRTPDNGSLRSLLAWLHMENRDFESALTEYRAIDQLVKSNGTEILNFAQRAGQERAFSVAAKAYQEVIDRYPRRPDIPHAKLGFARSMEELSSEGVSPVPPVSPQPGSPERGPVAESKPDVAGILSLYERIIGDYPNSDVAAQALFR
ncbi:MAG: tetratricopeptide repeat protein, partial [Bacteroidota bacterium]